MELGTDFPKFLWEEQSWDHGLGQPATDSHPGSRKDTVS